MKLLRYGPPGQEKPGILDAAHQIRDLSHYLQDWSDAALSPAHLARINGLALESLPLVPPHTRIGACVGNVRNFICIGLNYHDHVIETNKVVPAEPTIFNKITSCITGPYDPLILPRGSQKTDWEVELGVVIGTAAHYVTMAQAFAHVAGYCLINDISERAYQLETSGQWVKGKSCPTFGPIGPWLVTPDEIADVQNLQLQLSVDGTLYQDGNTKDMIFKVAYIISYLSQFFLLQPGDIISTGTPAGVGLGQKPTPRYLQAGQTIESTITGLGRQRKIVVAAT